MKHVAALRGATTVEQDTRAQVHARSQELVAELLRRNDLEPEDVISLVFTATEDITSEFPASAVRAAGIHDVPMLCARELAIVGDSAVPRCIRVLAHVHTTRARPELIHPYLHDARRLRRDLAS